MTDAPADPDDLTDLDPADVAALLAFLPWLRSRAPGDGVQSSGGYPVYVDQADALWLLLTRSPWIRRGYDPTRAAMVMQELRAGRRAGFGLRQLREVLTAFHRGDRFCVGYWAGCLDDGTALAAVEAVAAMRGG